MSKKGFSCTKTLPRNISSPVLSRLSKSSLPENSMKKSTLLLLSIISISLSLINSSNLFAEENPIPVLTQKAPAAAKYLKIARKSLR